MAILWQKQTRDTLYEIRGAGHSRRLYTNNVFHSQYNPRNSVTGNVWDLLSLPVFLFPTELPLKVLLLGVGGGAVIHQLQQWRGNCDITGIELNGTHLSIAKRFFGITPDLATLVQADAREWIGKQRKPKYDLIIDDLFGHADGEPQRAIAMTRDWVEKLSRLLKPGGVIVANFVDRRELTGSAFCACAPIRKQFPMRFQLSTPLYENRVGIFSGRSSFRGHLRSGLNAIPLLEKAIKSQRLKFKMLSLI